MPLNAEERYRQQMYKIQQQEDEADIAELEEELRLCKQTNDRINDELDQYVLQIDAACQQVLTDPEFGDGLFKDEILRIMGWPR